MGRKRKGSVPLNAWDALKHTLPLVLHGLSPASLTGSPAALLFEAPPSRLSSRLCHPLWSPAAFSAALCKCWLILSAQT